jgi:hypothetical protein
MQPSIFGPLPSAIVFAGTVQLFRRSASWSLVEPQTFCIERERP